MIGQYLLTDLLKKYKIDASKVIKKNSNILEYGEYVAIDKTLNYLINELEVGSYNIEKCPSIMYLNVDAIKENVTFLQAREIKFSSVETCLHVLSTNPYDLKQTYEYVIENYGVDSLNKITSILRVQKSRIKEIELLNIDQNNKMINLSAAVSRQSTEEIEKIIEVCKRNNIEISGSVFKQSAEEIEKIIEVCKRNNIEITGSLFMKSAEEIEKVIEACKRNNIEIIGSIFRQSAEEIEKIIEVCRSNNIEITGSLFRQSAEEIEKIIEACKRNNIEITGSLFIQNAEEIEKIIEVCKRNNIEITGGIFLKKSKDLTNSIEYIKNNYGQEYLKPLIINKSVKYLMQVFPYLQQLNVLPIVINSASILTLKLEEIQERKSILDMQGINMVDERGKFNSIFGMTRKKYNELKNKIMGQEAFNK